MKIRYAAALSLLLFAGAASAMDAHSFYVKGNALRKLGPAAMLTSDFRTLKAEAEAANSSVKAENARASANGKPLFCPPEKVDINPDALLAEFGKIPEKRRRAMTVRQAWREIAIRKYPC